MPNVEEKVPLAEAIRSSLSDEILHGSISPGTRLDEVELANSFNVSRTPVREAIKQLTASGLVEHRHRCGAFVSELPVDMLPKMFEYVAEMEALCARLASINMTQQERIELLAIHLDSQKHVVSGDIDAYDRANIKLHSVLFKGCHNRYVEEAVIRARAKVAPYRKVQFNVVDRMKSSYAEHDQMIKAVIKRESHEASDIMLFHIHQSLIASSSYIKT